MLSFCGDRGAQVCLSHEVHLLRRRICPHSKAFNTIWLWHSSQSHASKMPPAPLHPLQNVEENELGEAVVPVQGGW